MSREIVLAVDVARDPDAIFDVLTTQDGLAAVWTPDVTATPEPGARLRFGFEPAPVDLELTLAAADRGKRVVWRAGEAWPQWSGTTMTLTFAEAPQGPATRVILVHDGWPDTVIDGDLGSVAYTWSLVLGALQGYAETGKPQPALH